MTFAVFPDRQIQTVILIKAAVYTGCIPLLLLFDSINPTLLLLVQKCSRVHVEMKFSVSEVWTFLKVGPTGTPVPDGVGISQENSHHLLALDQVIQNPFC